MFSQFVFVLKIKVKLLKVVYDQTSKAKLPAILQVC